MLDIKDLLIPGIFEYADDIIHIVDKYLFNAIVSVEEILYCRESLVIRLDLTHKVVSDRANPVRFNATKTRTCLLSTNSDYEFCG